MDVPFTARASRSFSPGRGFRSVLCAWLVSTFVGTVGCGGGGHHQGTSSQDSSLSALSVSAGALSPSFATGTIAYGDTVGFFAASVQVTATTTDGGATLTVNGVPTASGQASALVALAVGPTPVAIVVTAAGGGTTTY